MKKYKSKLNLIKIFIFLKTIRFIQKVLKYHIFTKWNILQNTTEKTAEYDGEEIGKQGDSDSQREFFSFQSCEIYRADIENGFGRTVNDASATTGKAIHAESL